MKIVFGWLDILVGLVLVLYAIRGYRRGLSGEILQVVGLLASFIMAFQFFGSAGDMILDNMRLMPELAYILGYGIIFSIVYGFFFILRIFVHRIMSLSFIAGLERGGGIMTGMLRGLCMLSIVFVLIGMLRFAALTDWIVNNSFTGRYIIRVAPYIYNTVFVVWKKARRFDKQQYFMQINADAKESRLKKSMHKK